MSLGLLNALPIWELLPWDTDFLGFGVARLVAHALDTKSLAAQVNAARRANIRLLYLTADSVDARSNASARQAGAWLADRKVTFGMVVPAAAANWSVPLAVLPTRTWSAPLENLALQSGEFSRFRHDPRLSPDVFPRLYGQWLRNSLVGKKAREVLVYNDLTLNKTPFGNTPYNIAESSLPLGLLTLGLNAGRADIGLLAVATNARRRGVGSVLVRAAQQRAAASSIYELQVVTQRDNLLACSFYQFCGFVEWQCEHVYHLWL